MVQLVYHLQQSQSVQLARSNRGRQPMFIETRGRLLAIKNQPVLMLMLMPMLMPMLRQLFQSKTRMTM
jgi:hypothetical protein